MSSDVYNEIGKAYRNRKWIKLILADDDMIVCTILRYSHVGVDVTLTNGSLRLLEPDEIVGVYSA